MPSAVSALARRALLTAATLGTVGLSLGVFAIVKGVVTGVETWLILVSFTFCLGMVVVLTMFRAVPLQPVALIATLYFAFHLSAGAIIALSGGGQPYDFFIFLVWFFPLLVFNQLVNAPLVARLTSRTLTVAPLVLVVCLFPRVMTIFRLELQLLTAIYALSYLVFALMFTIVTQYREKYIVERERAEALRMEGELLESISDCFISLDRSSSLVYLNDAACKEFGIARGAVLDKPVTHVVPNFFSQSMLTRLEAAAAMPSASMFEAQNENRDAWYEMRCFPRAGGMSIYFRNVTEAVLSRRQLDEAHTRLSEQAELLDKAQDAIFVADLDNRIFYWNKSAERLYGWTARDVTGRLVSEIFGTAFEDVTASTAAVVRTGEWSGEVTQQRRDGSAIVVESRWTLVTAADGRPRSILSINTDITNRKAAEAQIERLAFYDALTELPNRVLLRESLNRALVTAARAGSTGALLFIDLDDFKTLNDTSGHDAGDLLLQQVAARLRSCVRAIDTVARLGGDEFVVMCEGLSGDPMSAAAHAKAIGDAIMAAFAPPFAVRGIEHATTASVGVALFTGHSDTADDLLKRADLAMYRAKAQGRNAMCFFDPAMQTFVADRAALQADLRRALTERAFELHYQPQVDVRANVLGAEALLRWRHPQRGMVPPSEFIPLAEASGLIVELGRWVLETACGQLARWALRGPTADFTISVNVSPRQFLDPGFVELVRGVLRASGANPQRLKLEITEGSVMENIADTIAKMTALRADGVGFSLDDFGTGYASLSQLSRLPLDQLKIDRSFVSDVLTDERIASIARTIITLGRNLNLAVIAEGVETPGQRAFLEREGCVFHQGYLFGPAVTAAAFEELAARGAGLEPAMRA